MRPPQVAIDFGTPPGSPSRTSSDDFERVPYPPEHYKSQQEEDLPLHYMGEDKARRRGVARTAGESSGHEEYYDDDGKDVYAKVRPLKSRVGSGRPRRVPPPPPATIVCIHFTTL
jgi:dolichyl-phosphate-mannose-protein mannosyltransferase